MSLQPPKSGQFSIGAFPAPSPKIETEIDHDNDDSIIDNDSNIIFPDILESFFTKLNQTDKENTEQPQAPILTKKNADLKSDEKNLLLNPILSPSFLFQNSFQNPLQNSFQNTNEKFPLISKEQFQIPANTLMKMNLTPIDNFSIGDYKFYPIYPDNLNIANNFNQETNEDKKIQNLQKYDAVDMELIKNGMLPIKTSFQDKADTFQELQKGDLVSLKPIENKTNNTLFDIPKINITISSLDTENPKIEHNILNKNQQNILEKINEKQPIINFGENFYGYPISHIENDNALKTDYYLFKKENSQEGEKQILIGVLSKDDDGNELFTDANTNKQIKPLLLGSQPDKPKISKLMTLNSLNYDIDKLLNSYLKNNEEGPLNNFENGFSKKNFKSFLAIADKPIFSNTIEEKITFNKDPNDNNNLNEFKNENPKIQQNIIKNTDDTINTKNFQSAGNFKFESLQKDKKSFDNPKNGNNQLNLDKLKLDPNRSKDTKEDAFFSFMSSQSENESKENKKGIEEKTSNDGKGIIFEKSISTQTATPIIISDKNNADFSNPMISAATRRAVDLSSQLQARGGGSAKIQIQDEKLGNIELNIHMKKDNTVTMEIKASDKDLKNILEKNSDTLKKSLDTQNISLTDFKVSTVEKSNQSSMNFASGQGFSQQQSQHNGQNSNLNSQDVSQQSLNQGFLSNNFTNGNNQFFKNPDGDFSFNKYPNQDYVNKNISFKNMEKSSITNIQRGANGSIKVLV